MTAEQNKQSAVCSRCKRTLLEDEYSFVEWTNCTYCGQTVRHECSKLLHDNLSDNGGSVCQDCWKPFLQDSREKNALLGEQDATDHPVGRLILNGLVDIMDVDAEYPVLRQVKQGGLPYYFSSTDYREEPLEVSELELHTAWQYLEGKTVEISCRVGKPAEQRESPHETLSG
jgi:DNA-directed RNA polymerase subunit RPC12/RpoP